MLISFVKGTVALLIKKERTLVVGDLHIGMSLKLMQAGLYFQDATERMAAGLLDAYKRSGARKIVLLGDVKESITAPKFAEYRELKLFFDKLKGIDIRVVKGNHDGNLEQVLRNIGHTMPVYKELLLEDIALLHGNTWPSHAAMRKKYVVVGHGHYAIRRGEAKEKVWLLANILDKAKKRYPDYNKSAKLVVAPSFNELIMGSEITKESKGYLPLFKNEVFSFEDAKVYSLDSSFCGKVKETMG